MEKSGGIASLSLSWLVVCTFWQAGRSETDLLALVSAPSGIERVKEWFNASDRPIVASTFLRFLQVREASYLHETATATVPLSTRAMSLLDTVMEHLKNVSDLR
jgi:hypothetical protein